MDFETVIKNRKSIRAFEEKPVDDDKINKILTLVNLAPSAGNLQAYKIFVIKNKDKIKLISKTTPGLVHFANLPAVIFVFCAVPTESAIKYGQRGRNLYCLQDATIACAYAQLAAAALGLGSCWVGAFDEEEIKKILQTDLLPVVILPIGYPAENPPRHSRKSLDQLSQEIT